MRTIASFDLKNYKKEWRTSLRRAVRVVIMRNGRIAMVKNGRIGYYKFPGGGKMLCETDAQTAVRETLEETGLSIIPNSLKELGMTVEVRRSSRRRGEIFKQYSYYYTASAENTVLPQMLEDYEKRDRYTLEWVTPEEAYSVDLGFVETGRRLSLKRELAVLELIMLGEGGEN